MSTLDPEPHCGVCREAEDVAALSEKRLGEYFTDYMTGKVEICQRHRDELAKRRPGFARSPIVDA